MTAWSVVFDDAPLGVLITEGGTRLVRYANAAFCQLVGLPPEALLGRKIAEAMPASIARFLSRLVDDAEASRKAPMQLADDPTGRQWIGVGWLLENSPAGEKRTIVQIVSGTMNAVSQTQYNSALEEIRAINSQLVVSNVRAQELLEQGESASRAKDNFLAMLGHELRNPLAPIRTSVEILRDAELSDPRMVAAREIIARQTRHMARLVDDLLDVSRLAHGKISLRKERLDVVEVVRATLEDYRTNLEDARLVVHPNLPQDPLWVVGDRIRLTQIVANILHNAIKFSEPGGEVHVLVTAEDQTAVIRVRDTGTGMEPRMVRDAFDLFWQAENTLSRSRGGLGVGLSLAKTLVELHAGEMHAASEGLGKGSEFVIRLPLTRLARPSTRHAPAEPQKRSARILVVEDNVDAADSMRVLLRLKGHCVEVAHNGNDALSVARDFHPDVVLCDIGLPGDMDGYAVARAIRADPHIPTPRMIALSGYAGEEDVALAHQAGFDQHLAKPIDPEYLLQFLSQGH